ncbi:hypothetical protein KKI24_07590 [bacterium]|nr:hypothetical protein [bacterium]
MLSTLYRYGPLTGGLILGLILFPLSLRAEYRAYLIEVYDHIAQKQWEERTGFSPDQYILSHGGGNRLTAYVKATWVCYGDTGGYTPACPIPDPIKPKFQAGERVRITLKNHITQNLVGTVELAYYQKSVKSNVYGVRFGDKRQIYNRYFEFDLVKADDGSTIQAQPATTAAPTGTTQ